MCGSSQEQLAAAILAQDAAIFLRLEQIVQSFGGTPVGTVDTLDNLCSKSYLQLLRRILAQRQSNYDMWYQVLQAT